MLDLYDKQSPIDSINLTEALKKTGKLDDVGGAYYITGLSQEAPTAANAEYYAKIVREKETLTEDFWQPIFDDTNFKDYVKNRYSI